MQISKHAVWLLGYTNKCLDPTSSVSTTRLEDSQTRRHYVTFIIFSHLAITFIAPARVVQFKPEVESLDLCLRWQDKCITLCYQSVGKVCTELQWKGDTKPKGHFVWVCVCMCICWLTGLCMFMALCVWRYAYVLIMFIIFLIFRNTGFS